MDAGHVLFQHVAGRSDEDIDLAAAALLVAEVEYPNLDVAHYLSILDGMGDAARARAGAGAGPRDRLAAVTHHLYEDLGFRGNEADYYDPKNSFLNEVIDRRLGIPITLSVLFLEVARRADLDVDGVGFPGHFLVQWHGPEGDVVLDPYHGGVELGRDELEHRLKQAIGQSAELLPDHLATASKRQILTRMLNNLRGIYQRAGERERERGVLERLAILNPSDARVEEALTALRPRSGGQN